MLQTCGCVHVHTRVSQMYLCVRSVHKHTSTGTSGNTLLLFLEVIHEPWGRKSGTTIAVANAATLLHPMTRLGEMFGSDQVPVDVGWTVVELLLNSCWILLEFFLNSCCPCCCCTAVVSTPLAPSTTHVVGGDRNKKKKSASGRTAQISSPAGFALPLFVMLLSLIFTFWKKTISPVADYKQPFVLKPSSTWYFLFTVFRVLAKHP